MGSPRKCAIALVVLVGHAAAQSPANGIAKYTMAVSNPLKALDWVIDEGKWPVQDCRTPGNNSICNGIQDCGLIGRTSLCPNKECAISPGPGDAFMFPHMINASARPIGDVSVEAVEAAFDAKYAHALAAGAYDAFLDFSLVVHASSLDAWADGSVLLEWIDNSNKTWYSAIAHVPGTQVQVEIISQKKPATGVVRRDPLMRYPATGSCEHNKCSAADDGVWTPLAVSKSVSDLDGLVAFYEAVLGAEVASSDDAVENVRLKTLYFPKQANMQVRLVERTGDDATYGDLTVQGLEALKMASHDVVAASTERAGALCGVDKWFDNHWGIDQRVVTLGQMIAAMEKRNWTRYHLWSWNMYLIDPSGDGVQADASWGDDAPSWHGEASADALMNLCSQGNCKAVANATAACGAALTSACGALERDGTTKHISDCANCAHWHRADLLEAGCAHADTALFCIGA